VRYGVRRGAALGTHRSLAQQRHEHRDDAARVETREQRREVHVRLRKRLRTHRVPQRHCTHTWRGKEARKSVKLQRISTAHTTEARSTSRLPAGETTTGPRRPPATVFDTTTRTLGRPRSRRRPRIERRHAHVLAVLGVGVVDAQVAAPTCDTPEPAARRDTRHMAVNTDGTPQASCTCTAKNTSMSTKHNGEWYSASKTSARYVPVPRMPLELATPSTPPRDGARARCRLCDDLPAVAVLSDEHDDAAEDNDAWHRRNREGVPRR
jgi:hypothetical protein